MYQRNNMMRKPHADIPGYYNGPGASAMPGMGGGGGSSRERERKRGRGGAIPWHLLTKSNVYAACKGILFVWCVLALVWVGKLHGDKEELKGKLSSTGIQKVRESIAHRREKENLHKEIEAHKEKHGEAHSREEEATAIASKHADDLDKLRAELDHARWETSERDKSLRQLEARLKKCEDRSARRGRGSPVPPKTGNSSPSPTPGVKRPAVGTPRREPRDRTEPPRVPRGRPRSGGWFGGDTKPKSPEERRAAMEDPETDEKIDMDDLQKELDELAQGKYRDGESDYGDGDAAPVPQEDENEYE